MFSIRLLSLAALASTVYGHSQILAAQGIAGSPSSTGFLGKKNPDRLHAKHTHQWWTT